MNPEQALKLFDAALAIDHPVAMATRLDRAAPAGRPSANSGGLPALFERPGAHARRRRLIDDTVDAAQSMSVLAQRLHGLAPDRQHDLLVGMVRLQAAAVLGHPAPEDIEPNTPFQDLGFDSLSAVELRNRLKTATGLTLPPTLIFDHPSPTAAADYIGRSRSLKTAISQSDEGKPRLPDDEKAGHPGERFQ